MADPLDAHDLAAIRALAKSGLWEQSGLIEALRLQELLKKQEILDALMESRRTHSEVALPQKPVPEPSRLTEIKRDKKEGQATFREIFVGGRVDGQENVGSPLGMCMSFAG